MAVFGYETDKTKIKNGMVFKYTDDYYLKFGKNCIKLDYPFSFELFEDVSPESIEMIYKINGEPLLIDKKIKIKLGDEDKSYEINKSKIESGMVFKMNNKHYLKVDYRCIYIDLFNDEKIMAFNKVSSLGILMIFNCRGVLMLKSIKGNDLR